MKMLVGSINNTVHITFGSGTKVQLQRSIVFGAGISDELSGVGLMLEESEEVSIAQP